jgi:hypothetical protein
MWYWDYSFFFLAFIPKVKERLKGSQGIMLLCGGYLIIFGIYYLIRVMLR